jgi:hypothetical protein
VPASKKSETVKAPEDTIIQARFYAFTNSRRFEDPNAKVYLKADIWVLRPSIRRLSGKKGPVIEHIQGVTVDLKEKKFKKFWPPRTEDDRVLCLDAFCKEDCGDYYGLVQHMKRCCPDKMEPTPINATNHAYFIENARLDF